MEIIPLGKLLPNTNKPFHSHHNTCSAFVIFTDIFTDRQFYCKVPYIKFHLSRTCHFPFWRYCAHRFGPKLNSDVRFSHTEAKEFNFHRSLCTIGFALLLL